MTTPFFEVLRFGQGVWRVVSKPFKRLSAERRAAANPARATKSLTEKVADATRVRLGASEREKGWLGQLMTAAGRLALKQGIFGLPYMNEWLSQPDVAGLLNELHEAGLAGAELDPKKIEQLSQSFQEKTGEHSVQAESAIRSVLAALRQGTLAAVSDAAQGALIQAASSQTQAGFASMKEEFKQLGDRLPAPPSDSARLFADQEATRELDRLLITRALPGEETVQGLGRLAIAIREGQFVAASPVVKIKILNWLARFRAWQGDVVETEALLAETSAMGGSADLPTQANLASAKGDVGRALRLVEDLDSPEGRSSFFALLTKYKAGEGVAERYLLDGRLDDPTRFTADGWVNALATLVNQGHFKEAHTVCDALTPELISAQPYLAYISGIVAALEVVPLERRAQILQIGPDIFGSGSLDGPAAKAWRNRSLASFKRALEGAKNLGAPLFDSACRRWIRVLRLTDQDLRQAEVASLQAEMMDGKAAVDLILLAQAHKVDFDKAPLEAYLQRQELYGSLTNDGRVAKAVLLSLSKSWGELVEYLEAEWSHLSELVVVNTLVSEMVVALVKMKDLHAADLFLLKHRASIEPSEHQRLGLMIAQARGSDPAAAATTLYEATGKIVDLRNVIAALAQSGRWSDAVPYSRILFDQESNVDTALQHLDVSARAQAPTEQVLEFIEHAEPRIATSLDFQLHKAWTLFLRGQFLEARAIADELASRRDDARDLSLDINLALQSGDWERFPGIVDRVWQKRAEFEPRTLLLIASMAGLSDPTRALDIASEAVARNPGDSSLAMTAYSLAVQLGKDQRGSAWLTRAVENQAPGVPLRSFNLRQTIDLLQAQQVAWQQKNEDFRFSRYPIHLAAVLFNAPLTRFLVDIPAKNAAQADARRRMPLPFRNGRRGPVDCSKFKTIALDVTTIFHADQFGFLDRLLARFDVVYVASQVFRLLLEEKQRVVFHQPSRIADAKPLLHDVDHRRIQVQSGAGDPELTRKIGEEAASLLTAAKARGGMFVHDGALYEVTSFMEKTADLADLQGLVITPLDVANALFASGRITQRQLTHASEVLRRPEAAERTAGVTLTKVFLDRVAIEALQRAGVLKATHDACSEVMVHESAVLEWRALVSTEAESELALEAIDRIRRSLRAGLLSAKVRLLPTAPESSASFIGEKGMALFDVASSGGIAEAVALDDRLLNRDPGIVDTQKRAVPLACVLDLVDLLVSSGEMDASEVDDIYHQLRLRCMYCVPLSVESLARMIGEAQVSPGLDLAETAHLRGLREYIARLIAGDALCTEDDRFFMDALWQSGSEVIRALWADATLPLEKVMAACNWILACVLPSIEAAVSGADQPAARIEQLAAARAMVAVSSTSADPVRQEAQREWVNAKVLAKLLPAGGEVLDRVANSIAAMTLQRLREVADEADGRNDAGVDAPAK